MKRKLLAVLAAVVAATPLAGVHAADIQYTIGTEHNFIVNKQQEAKHNNPNITQEERDSVGIKVISLGAETDDGYVKALSTGGISFIFGGPDVATPINTYKDLGNYQTMYADLNGNTGKSMNETFVFGKGDNGEEYQYIKDIEQDEKWIDIMSVEDFLTWRGASKTTLAAGETYNLTATELETFKKWFGYEIDFANGFKEELEAMKDINPAAYEENKNAAIKGIFTKSYDKTTNKIWVVDMTIANKELTGVTVREVAIDAFGEDDGYVTVPILYFNKTYDCKFKIVTQNACFKCGEEYQWIEVGKQASTCEAVSSITAKSKCVKPSNTGIEDYILEFAIAAGICGLVLVAVKRKSLFSRV